MNTKISVAFIQVKSSAGQGQGVGGVSLTWDSAISTHGICVCHGRETGGGICVPKPPDQSNMYFKGLGSSLLCAQEGRVQQKGTPK